IAIVTFFANSASGLNITPWISSARFGAGALALLVSISLAWLYLQLLWPLPVPPPPKGDDNQYQRIAEIGDVLSPSNFDRPDNEDVLGLEVQRLLKLPNYVTFDPAHIRDDLSNKADIGCLGLKWWLDAQGQAAIEMADFDRASDFALSNSRLATMW